MRLAWLGAIAGLAASSVSAQVGLFADAAGTDCDIVTEFQTPVTAYVVLGPGAQPTGLQRINLRLIFVGGTDGLLLAATPGSAVAHATGDIFVNPGADIIVDGLCPLAGPVVLYTVTITRTAVSASARQVIASSTWTFCPNPISVQRRLDTTLDGVAPTPVAPFDPRPADQATNVVPGELSDGLSWLPSIPNPPRCWVTTYRVYFGTDPNPPLIATTATQSSVILPPFAAATTYFWRVEAFLAPSGTVISGPLWSFTTQGVCPQICEIVPPACPAICMFASSRDWPDLCFDTVSGTHTFITPCVSHSIRAHASFDRSTGTVVAEASSPLECPGTSSDVVAGDRFRLVGPAAAEPIAFTARLDFEGHNFPSAALREGDGDVVWQGGTRLQIALQHLPGHEFIVRYGVRAFGDGGREPAFGASHGQLSFPDLPAGYTIASCAGYGAAVATTPASWSSIKELYRR